MTITVEIPDDLVSVLSIDANGPSRAVLEAVAFEGYRKDLLSEAAIRRLLGFDTRMDVHGFLKDHGVYMHFTIEDLEHDSSVALNVARRHRSGLAPKPVQELHA